MKIRHTVLPAVAGMLAFACACKAGEPTLAERILSSYDAVDTLSCAMRKNTVRGETSVRMLSRISYKRKDRINVENTAPTKRRVVSNGTNLYYYEEGSRYGFSKPVEDLNENWLASLRNIPATPMENLRKLRGLAETTLPPDGKFTIRRGYDAEKVFVVLACDDNERLLRVQYFRTPAMKKKVGQYDYQAFKHVEARCWVPRTQIAVLSLPDGSEIKETRHVNALRVNEPMADTLFDAKSFFPDIVFTNVFTSTFDGGNK